ncbi:MAG: glucose-1-phosphate thymidylyltransferase RfbA [Candidatus Omnitrophota bacterium]
MKGIILAGGRATRLYPITKGVCKQLLPVYDKPMIYYPLSVLMLIGIRDILIISTEKDIPRFKDVLGDGRDLGIRFVYAVQKEPKGIAESLIIGADFIGNDSVCLILGDNIFYGHNLGGFLREYAYLKDGAVVFGYYVKNPQRYGVIELGERSEIISIKEKPKQPKSNFAVTGLYFYDHKAVELAKQIQPSKRGELEITDLNNRYLKRNKLKVKLLSRGFTWLDMGDCDSLIDASLFIKTIEERQGLKIGCIEEVAFRMGYITKSQLRKVIKKERAGYSDYLKRILTDE